MPSDGSLPSYDRLFGDLDLRPADQTRSVHSPAAYLADLLQLAADAAGDAVELEEERLSTRRPDLAAVRLDGENSYTEVPYLDIVNEVLAAHLAAQVTGPAGPNRAAADAYELLAGLRHPFTAPFDLGDERVRLYLRHLGVDAVDLYRRFAARPAPDTVTREFLGLTAADVRVLTTELGDGPDLRDLYALDDTADAFDRLSDVDAFRRATGLSGAELDELLTVAFVQGAGPAVSLDGAGRQLLVGGRVATAPVDWFDRVNRFVRLARRVGMSFADLGLVLRDCCGNRIDPTGLRRLAVVRHLGRALDLPVDAVVGLVAPVAAWQGTVGAGDILSSANGEYRRRVAAAVGLGERDLAATVRRHRDRRVAGVFTGAGTGVADLSLLSRVGRLTAALGISVDELFAVLDALAADPSIRRLSTFPILVDTARFGPGPVDVDRTFAGADVGDGLWLMQTLVAVVRWCRTAGLGAADLMGVLRADGAGSGAGVDADRVFLATVAERFAAVEPAAEVFRSARFGGRAAQVVHDVLATADPAAGADGRLLRVPAERMTDHAHTALDELDTVASNDFRGLGLADRLVRKLHTNLMLAGYVTPGGTVAADRVPESADELRLQTGFGAYRKRVFALIARLCAAGVTASCYPSDLATLADLAEARRPELYDNLIYNGYLAESGEILAPAFFDDPANAATFAVDAVGLDDGALAADVHDLLAGRLLRCAGDRPVLDPAILATLPLTSQDRAALIDSLTVNGHLDPDGRYADPTGLIDLPLADLRLSAQFHPYRRRVLDAMRAELVTARDAAYRLEPADLWEPADTAVARRVGDLLARDHLRDGRLTAAATRRLSGPAATLDLSGFTDAENATIALRLRTVLADARPYRLDVAALDDLTFSADERRRLVRRLVDAGHLTETLTVPAGRVEYFGYAPNAVDFALPGLADYSTDIFFLLHAVATEVAAGVAQIVAVLRRTAAEQDKVLAAVLAEELGVPAATASAICDAVLGVHAVTLIVEPALEDAAAAARDTELRRTLRRMRGFARFAAALSLNADEVAAVFLDQDLAGRFPEPLALPAGVDRIDALLDSADGAVYLFHGVDVWAYSAATRALTDTRPRTLASLSPALAALSAVDAAFVDGKGAEWIVGRDAVGVAQTFVREPGHPRWQRRAHEWGVADSTFDDPTRIDAAYVDDGGRAYLFHGDRYVRHSGDDHAAVDEGYPRRIADWGGEVGRTAPLPERFRRSWDAAFRGHDDTTYLFAGDSFLAVRDGDAADPGVPRAADTDAVVAPVAGFWGRIANVLADTGRVDAAYVDGPALHVYSGHQVTRYTGGVEHADLVADEGYPRRIEAHHGDVPAEFEGGVEAAFADGSGAVHLFKDGRTVSLRGGGGGAVIETARRWGRLTPALPTDAVDAVMVGRDGRTYLFSGDVYLRYSGADYSLVDVGYPRRVAGDWGGLRRVDAAFVADGATHLFGSVGALFDLSVDEGAAGDTAELSAGRLPWRLRQRLLAHGIAVGDDPTVAGSAPRWTVTVDGGLRLVLTLTPHADGGRLEVSGDPATGTAFHVRYSTTDYAVPDPGFPRPLSENWWNLPDDLAGPSGAFARVDAVFTARDGRTYLFAGDQFVAYDTKRRWWSEPRPIAGAWGSLPFARVDAAFVGVDGRTYLFRGDRYARYSTASYTRVDDRYPAPVVPFWGNVVNNIARTGRVDATLVAGEHTYLFSGDQFVRYTRDGSGHPPNPDDPDDPGPVDIGYPRRLSALGREPRLLNLRADLTTVSAAFADRATVYLVSGERWHAVSAAAYRRYDDLAAAPVGCALVEDGAVHLEHPDGWHRYSALEGAEVARSARLPRALRPLPARWRTDLDAVLHGADGNTYLFQGRACVDVGLGREYPLAEAWGRPRNAICHDNAVDAAFVGVDGRTYVFRDDQFVVYTGDTYAGVEVDGAARPVAEHWGGLRRVALAYVRDGSTYLFEPPDDGGTMRYVVYSGVDYRYPDDGCPRVADASFWAVPDEHRSAGFTAPRAVLASGASTLLLIGATFLQHNNATGAWSRARPLERIWPGIGAADGLTAAFTGRDGATYFFFGGGEFARHDGSSTPARQRIDAHWGRTRNNFLAEHGEDVVDAALVHRGVTFLFAGDQYVRYSEADYRFADTGYPKPIVGNLRAEPAFAALPAAVEDEFVERFAAGHRSMIDAAVTDGRTTYLFTGRTCHAVSDELTADYDTAVWGRVRNRVADTGRVDAALVTGGHTYLFSGDQYVRYTGGDHTRVDDGYPRTIAAGLPAELNVAALPSPFCDGLDAALRAGDGTVHLFAGTDYARIAGGVVTVEPIRGAWGVVRNAFRAGRAGGAGLDAAFVAATGDLYAFAGDQYVRYAADRFDTVADGYPRRIRDDWGDLPGGFESGVDGAFRFAGRTYLARGAEYVRYSADRFDTVDRTYPQPFTDRWSDGADYRLCDLHAASRFAALARAHRDTDGGLSAFVLPARAVTADPYARLAAMFGWDAAEVAWCRRHLVLLTGPAAGGPGGVDGDRLELEFLLALADVFELADRFGTGPSRLHTEVWTPLHGAAADPHRAADVLHDLAERAAGPQRWPTVSRQLHDELNLRIRDALVAALTAGDARGGRDLFARLLIDVDMGARGTTSRVREAIAATQLYLHRYLLNLEVAGGDEQTRARIRQWWQWMRNYRVWEANRKVFLYPENYLRPELRAGKSPAFAALEGELLQGEITAASVEGAYKRYLDEYAEVSRLAIAGGYLYTKDQRPDGARRLVLFGRTRTDPRRYYYRRAEFASREKLSALWEPWQPVDLQIDADQVHPVHAFGRVFVFWATPEAVPADDTAGTAVVARSKGDEKHVTGRPETQRIRIRYSFHNLTKEWSPEQTLGLGGAEIGAISGVTMLVAPRMKDAERMSVVVSCAYTVTTPPDPAVVTPSGKPARATTRRAAVLFELNPELYSEDLLATGTAGPAGPARRQALAVAADIETARARAATADRVASIFVDPVDPAAVVRLDAPSGSEFWFSVDHKGGSFLCRPVTVHGTEGTRLPLAGNRDRLPDWTRVDAAVELADGTRFFFDNAERRCLRTRPRGPLAAPTPTSSTWGLVRVALAEPGPVDAVIVRGKHTFVLSGQRYVRFTGTPFGQIDAGYPKEIAGNCDALPDWPRVDAAFTGPDGVEHFFDHTRDRYVTSADLCRPQPVSVFWRRAGVTDAFGRIDGTVVTATATLLRNGQRYLRLPHPSTTRRGGRPAATDTAPVADPRQPLPVAGNTDGLPTDFTVSVGVVREGVTYWFDNDRQEFHEVAADGARTVRPTHVTSAVARTGRVDAAWLAAGRLYLTTGAECVRYTIAPDGSVPTFVDDGYPAAMPWQVDAAFTRDDDVYLFHGDRYARVDARQDPTRPADLLPTAGAWGELPRTSAPPFDAALDTGTDLFLFVDDTVVRHSKTIAVRRPYELAGLPFDIVRLTAGTASALSQKLLSGGLPALLDLDTQETDEVAVTTDPDAMASIRVRPRMVDATRLPTGSHLDFRSANGQYYWEIFFHAPFLIAQTLNGAQRFEDARRWYEHIFDPTSADSYWRFLPFLIVDLDALADVLTDDLAALVEASLPTDAVASALNPVVADLRRLAPAVLQNRDPGDPLEDAAMGRLIAASTHRTLADAVDTLADRTDLTSTQRRAVDGLREHTLMAADLTKVFDALGDRTNLLKAYQDNPFDPHAIADLRPVAYRRAVVMRYIDNLLDWGDMLFRQYTPESVDEARMLYILAYDLLGRRRERLGTRLLPDTASFAGLDDQPGDLDLTGYFTGGGTLVTGGSHPHGAVADTYFHIPDNEVYDEYLTRVEDRLRKIRQSLDIMGISQPLPLFAPPIDPAALVASVAAGGAPDGAAAGTPVPVPHHRFTVVLRRAQELVDRLRQLGSDLLSVLERGSAEELGLLQRRQEQEILALTRAVKAAQIRVAEEAVAELTVGRQAAETRIGHYETLIANGMSAREKAQIDRMNTAVGMHYSAGVLKVAAGIAFAVPEFHIGPFIVGTDVGGRHLGDTIDKASETLESLAEGFGMAGEVLGVQAQHDRMVEDWGLELAAARSDKVQLDHRVAGAGQQLDIARREADQLEREITHSASVATFLRDRFTNAELYGWMSGELAGLYFQTYQLAHEAALAAQRAYQFERGVDDDAAATFIRPQHWQSRRGGLLAGDSLALDLDRLAKAYADTGARGLEITRRVSLRAVDPLALLALRESGTCEFALTEALFAADFPGHYRRQIRTVTVTFLDSAGDPVAVPATLTQLGHQTVLRPDPQAVRFLLEPQGAPPAAVRVDWRARQQIALSDPDGGRENNGLFDLRFDDDRYLPFEGTGAVSRWRLERGGRPVHDLFDVTVTVKHTAEQGGEVFANAVRGLLKPYPAARLFDLARDFPDEWNEFVSGAGDRLSLPFTAQMFPDLAGPQIGGIVATYELADGSATRLVLGGDPAQTLAEGRLLQTPGLAVRPTASKPWTFTVDGAKDTLRNVGLVLTYQARVQ